MQREKAASNEEVMVQARRYKRFHLPFLLPTSKGHEEKWSDPRTVTSIPHRQSFDEIRSDL